MKEYIKTEGNLLEVKTISVETIDLASLDVEKLAIGNEIEKMTEQLQVEMFIKIKEFKDLKQLRLDEINNLLVIADNSELKK